MTRKAALSVEHLDKVRQYVSQGLSDREMAELLGCKTTAVTYFRNQHHIRSGTPLKPKTKYQPPELKIVAAIRCYMEKGILITVYPPMWANGIHPQRNVKANWF